jgi:predicted RNA-binding protein (virulence factor B family)
MDGTNSNANDSPPPPARQSPPPSSPFFKKGDMIQVEVVRFGPLGASVEVISHLSHDQQDLIPQNADPLAYGLILQREISYFRSSRNEVDVVLGEILPAYVDWVRDDGKIDVSLRKPGGKGKADELSKIILEKLNQEGGELSVGDKSTPGDINAVLPGASKASFKRAVAALYKKRLVQPGPFTTKLM